MQQYYTLLLSLGWLVFTHPFHLSLTEIKYNSTSERLEISQKIFWDDLEIALTEYHDEPIDFLNPPSKEKLNKQIESYLNTQSKIWVEEKAIGLKFLGFEVEEDAAWFYLESENVENPISIKVKNSVLVENFPDQKNVIQFYYDSHSPKSIILGKGNESGTLNK